MPITIVRYYEKDKIIQTEARIKFGDIYFVSINDITISQVI